MPSYIVTIPEGRLSTSQKRDVAEAVTRAHGDATGAPYYFAQVTFNEVKSGNYFLGGKVLDGDQIFVHGTIRDGRPAEMKDELMRRLLTAVSVAADCRENCCWVYVSELTPTQMIEFGRVLPKHGQEAKWSEELPANERTRLKAIGIQHREPI